HYNYQTKETTYFYRTNKKLIGQTLKPIIEKKHYRLGTRSLNSQSILDLARANPNYTYSLHPPSTKKVCRDFQEFLITHLLLLSKTATFVKTPLELEHVPKEDNKCNGD
ncbi:7086_t:CDS:1, partial [Ambispora leptoticha]